MTARTLADRLKALEERSPQHYSTLRNHAPLLQRALENTSRPYPTSRQLYKALENPSLPAQTFGRLIALLADLKIIDIYTQRSGGNRYDIDRYDPTEFEQLETLFEQQQS